MVQDIEEEFRNKYCNLEPKNDDVALCFKGDCILMSMNGNRIEFPTVAQTESTGEYLFEIAGKRYFLGNTAYVDGYDFYSMKTIRTAVPKHNAFAAASAYHLYNWYKDNKHCGKCGAEMHHSVSERALVCKCGNTVYPKISPAVIVGIISGDKICLTKYNRPNTNWALVAGFNEIGETIEETVHREVMEEVGLKVKNLKYYKSQPWGLTSTLLFGFYCTVDDDEKIKLDDDELKEGKWFTANEIDFKDDGFSLTREMIENFRRGLVI